MVSSVIYSMRSSFVPLFVGFCAAFVGACQTGENQRPLTALATSPVSSKVLSPDEQAFQSARHAFGIGDYHTSYAIASRLASEGYAPAYNLLHFHYRRGLVVKIDRQMSVEMLRKGVAGGDPLAEANLGGWYRRGANVKKDYQKAMELLKSSIAKGNTIAKERLAIMYAQGQGVEKDIALSRKLKREVFDLTKAEAEAGDIQSLYRHGIHLIRGVGTRKDPEAGVEVIKRAADAGSMAAIEWLAREYSRGRYMRSDLVRRIHWLKKSADAGVPISQLNLAFSYKSGAGIERDERKAVDLMRAAAKQGLRFAAHELSRLLLTGKTIKPDPVEAAYWSKDNAEFGFVPSMVIYGYLLETGAGVARDFAAAHSWYQKALAKGRRDISDRLGRMYLYGNGVEKNPTQAVRYFEQALKIVRPGPRRVRIEWLRQVAITNLSPGDVVALKTDGFLGDVSAESVGKEAANPTAAVIARLSKDAPEQLVPLLSDTLEYLGPESEGTRRVTLILRSVAHYRAGRYKEALSDADLGMSLGEPRAVDFAHRGQIHLKMENYADSRSDFTSALRLAPDEPQYYVSRGFAQIRIGKQENIIAGFLDFRKAFDLDPANAKFRPLFERLGFFRNAI